MIGYGGVDEQVDKDFHRALRRASLRRLRDRVPAAQPQVFPSLTDRGREILNLIAQGHSNPSIVR